MRRRDLLRALGAGAATGAAGCSRLQSLVGPDRVCSVSVVGVDDEATAYRSVTAEATTTSGGISPASTAGVELTFTNESDGDRQLQWRKELCDELRMHEAGGAGLVLLPEGHDRAEGDCWTPTGPLFCGVPVTRDSALLEPGDARSFRFELWARPDADGCIEPGEYTFEKRFQVFGVGGPVTVDLRIEGDGACTT